MIYVPVCLVSIALQQGEIFHHYPLYTTKSLQEQGSMILDFGDCLRGFAVRETGAGIIIARGGVLAGALAVRGSG